YVSYACLFSSSRRRHTRFKCDWSSDVCSSDLLLQRCRMQRLAASDERLFDGVEAAREFLVGATQRGFGFDAQLAREIGDGKEKRSEERRVGKECRAGWWSSASNSNSQGPNSIT